MARTLVQIKKQIKSLEQEAEKVRASEVAGVVQRIKSAIDFYGLTPSDLFGSPGRSATRNGRKKASAIGKGTGKPKRKSTKTPSPAKYRDKETGKTWTGHGKRPGWFVQAIANGAKPEDMAV